MDVETAMNVPPGSDHARETFDPLAAALTVARAGGEIAIARVIRTWGSAPRPVGSVMTIDAAGRIMGSVSGGCVESDVAAVASDILRGGVARVMSFRIGTADAQAAGLACGGELELIVEAVRADGFSIEALERTVMSQAARRPVLLLTRLDDVPHTIALTRDHDPRIVPEGLTTAVSDGLDAGISGRMTDVQGASWFLHGLPLRPRLLILGGVHIAQALAPLAVRTGYDVTVIDPRDGLATAARFPGITCSDHWPDEALMALGVDADTAVVALMHDEALDDPALAVALRAGAGYVGALGSRRTHRLRMERLAANGLDAADLGRLRGPIGLAIGAVGAQEIAVSILAEIIAVRREGPLRERQGW